MTLTNSFGSCYIGVYHGEITEILSDHIQLIDVL